MPNLSDSHWRIPVILFLLITCSAFFSDLYVPSLPAIAVYFHETINWAQATLALFVLGFAMGQFIYGPFADYFGRRKVILLALMLCCLASLLCALANNIILLLLGRFMQGLTIAACLTLSRAMMRDIYQGTQMAKMGSLISAGVEAALALAPVIGGYLTFYYGWRSNFYFLLGSLLMVVFLTYAYLPETMSATHKRTLNWDEYKKNCSLIFSQSQFFCYVVGGGISYALVIIYFSVSPFILQNQLHLSSSEYGLTSLVISMGLMTGAILNNRLVAKIGIERMVITSTLAILAAGILFCLLVYIFSVSIYTVLLPSMLVMLCAAVLFANCYTGALSAFPHMAATASSIYSGLQISGAFILIYLVMLFGVHEAMTLAFIYIVLGSIAFIALKKLITSSKLPPF